MAIFAITYTYAADSASQRDQYRPEHREHLTELAKRDQLLLSGPINDDGPPAALLIVRAGDASEAERLLAEDPFQREGLVAEIGVRAWEPVLGSLSGPFVS
ncbi:YciI family protein [Naumannella halotolerans]|uniref:YCII-related domain-containing protein n=1 Tax=Naumannella halotolerans TaxID=993414 RepID=A0A4R7J551_9ACTN|nr:YciI family protein [Naumannella halotolerans]TDT32460.1 hypothetical protein CLV29_0035 [Naumannella halotolerans]